MMGNYFKRFELYRSNDGMNKMDVIFEFILCSVINYQ